MVKATSTFHASMLHIFRIRCVEAILHLHVVEIELFLLTRSKLKRNNCTCIKCTIVAFEGGNF